MRSTGLVLMGGAAALVVGYAFYTLLTPPPPRPRAERSRGEAGARAADEEPGADQEDGPRARPRPSGPASAQPVRRSAIPVEPAPAQAGPPPRPKPEISLEEARKHFADYMAELDDLELRGVQLTSPEWVEYYKRGADAILPLQQHLDWQVPEQADELRHANEDMRAKLGLLDPGRQTPPI